MLVLSFNAACRKSVEQWRVFRWKRGCLEEKCITALVYIANRLRRFPVVRGRTEVGFLDPRNVLKCRSLLSDLLP